jgi:hypothetical protein
MENGREGFEPISRQQLFVHVMTPTVMLGGAATIFVGSIIGAHAYDRLVGGLQWCRGPK